MVTHNRGRSLARQTKVMDSCHSPLKNGRHTSNSLSCDNDASTSKPTNVGRVVADDTQDSITKSCLVRKCGKSRCKTCKHIIEGDSFSSNTTSRQYLVVSPNTSITCETKNVIYLISCRIQYVGETSQPLRNRMNNHRQRLKQLSDLFLYQHFCSDGHSEDDIAIMPIEEVYLRQGENISLASKRLQREEHWYRELASIYPYGLNDNVRKLGNVSRKNEDSVVIWSLFNRIPRKPEQKE